MICVGVGVGVVTRRRRGRSGERGGDDERRECFREEEGCSVLIRHGNTYSLARIGASTNLGIPFSLRVDDNHVSTWE
jgi:hypothetical protein